MPEKFVSQKTLKKHRLICNLGKIYKCKDCKEEFKSFFEHYTHRRTAHLKLACDFCNDVISDSKNIRRHLKTKHKGITPAKAKALETIYMTIEKHKTIYKCKECDKIYYDKSTLNCHMKQHKFHCDNCGDIFTFKDYLLKHKEVHKTTKHDVFNVIGIFRNRERN